MCRGQQAIATGGLRLGQIALGLGNIVLDGVGRIDTAHGQSQAHTQRHGGIATAERGGGDLLANAITHDLGLVSRQGGGQDGKLSRSGARQGILFANGALQGAGHRDQYLLAERLTLLFL